MKINSEVANNQKQLHSLNRRLKKNILQREKEIKQVNDNYNKKFKELRDINEVELNQVHTNSNQEISQALNKRKDKLTEIKNQLTKEQDLLNKERESLKSNHQVQMADIDNTFAQKYQNKYLEGTDEVEQLDVKNRNFIEKLKAQSNQEMRQFAQELAQDKSNVLAKNEFALESLDNQYAQKIYNQEKLYNQQFYQKNKEFNKSLEEMNRQQNNQTHQKVELNKKQIAELENNHKLLMHEKEVNFRAKYAQLSKNHDLVMQNMKSRFEQNLKDLNKNYMTQKENAVDKSQDGFYRITTLDPAILDYGKFYEIALDVPEHEAENVNLTADQRELKLSMTRSFKGKAKDAYGDLNQSIRTESFTKKVQVEDMLNRQEVARKYEDGTLYFRIAKL